MERPISTRVHGILDYLMVGALFVLPRILGWSAQATMFLTIMAVVLLVASLITRYELGVFRIVPMPMHLMLDFAAGALFVMAAVLLADEPNPVQWTLGLLGVAEMGAALLTDRTPAVSEDRVGYTRNRAGGL